MEIGRARLVSQGIEGNQFSGPQQVVRRMGAVQAQSYVQSTWALGLRTPSTNLAGVQMSISEGQIVQTWPNRGTLHFVPAEDARWMLELLAPRNLSASAGRRRQLELDEKTLSNAARVLARALQGRRRLTRRAAMALLESAGISPEGQRGYHILWYLAQTGLICLGPLEGKQQTIELLEERVAMSRELRGDEALVELAYRYFAGHGPATVRDFATWAGITLTSAREGAAQAGLIAESYNGTEYLAANEPGRDAGKDGPGIHLLPGFDEYLLGYRDRDAVLDPAHATQVAPGNNGMFKPMIVVDGRIVGTWTSKRRRTSVEIVLEQFVDATDLASRVRPKAERYASFLGLTLESVSG